MTGRNAQCKVAGVKGISDAVRGAMSNWVTEDLVTLLFTEYQKTTPTGVMAVGRSSFTSRIRHADDWKRYRRGNDPKGTGFFRTYYCRTFGKGLVDLQVLTNFDDTKIKYVTFQINGKTVYGGACNVPSALFSQYDYQPTLANTVKATATSAAPVVVAFVPFTEKQLQELATQYEFGGMGAIDRMFEERV